ncbi:MAG: hypothetical protein IJS09_02965 [Treponema sp.]|nr:hypothetical protein [Treponema sp.]
MVKRFFFCLPILLAFSFFSCSDANPQLILASGSMVFDYADENSLPQTRMAVFVQMESAVQRADSLEMESRDTGYHWRVSSPKLFQNGEKKWACYTNIQPPAKETIPAGVYDFRYIDATGEEAISSFIVAYPKNLLETKAGDVQKLLPSVTENLALYDKNNVLIFFGKTRSNWISNASILRDYPNAITKRRCLSADNNRVVCLMPEESMFEKQKETSPDNEDEDSND